MLEMVNLASGRGDKAQQVYNDMLNEYYALQGIDRRSKEIEANWEDLRIVKRG